MPKVFFFVLFCFLCVCVCVCVCWLTRIVGTFYRFTYWPYQDTTVLSGVFQCPHNSNTVAALRRLQFSCSPLFKLDIFFVCVSPITRQINASFTQNPANHPQNEHSSLAEHPWSVIGCSRCQSGRSDLWLASADVNQQMSAQYRRCTAAGETDVSHRHFGGEATNEQVRQHCLIFYFKK